MTTKHQCSCEDCKELCQGHPGRFEPGQVKLAAKHMGVSVREFFDRYLTVDFVVGGDNGEVNLLSPRWANVATPRANFSDAWAVGPCALLTPTGCSLPLDLRPVECAVADHKSNGRYTWRKLLAKWDTQAGRDEIDAVFE